MEFLKQIEALTAIESLKVNYFCHASALKVLAELEPLAETGFIPELIRTRQGFPQGRSLESYNNSLSIATGVARKETASGLSFLASVCTIALCSFLEDAVKEVVAREIVQHPEKWEHSQSAQVNATLNPMAENDALSIARICVEKRYMQKSNRGDNAFNKLLSLLKQVGWSNGLTPALSRTLREMYEIRNAIVHCGARVDKRLKREVVRYASSGIGSTLSLDETQFKMYLSAVDDLVNTVILTQLGFNPHE